MMAAIFLRILLLLIRLNLVNRIVMNRIILHSDINCFYASIEHLYRPELNNRPLAVGGDPEKRHGIILTADYLSRKYGVRTGMPLWQAYKLCPDLNVVMPQMDLYREYSEKAHRIYADYTNFIEPYGIDESWLDVSATCRNGEEGRLLACEINRRMKKELGITNSVGISWNKVFAKLGSDYKKPDGITVFMPEQMDIIRKIPVQDLLYVGKNTCKKLNNIGIYNIGHLADTPENILVSQLGKMGITFKRYAMGLDDDPVNSDDYIRTSKSIGNSTTTAVDLTNNDEVRAVLYDLAERVAYRLKKHHVKGKVLELHIRTEDLRTSNRQCHMEMYTDISDEIAAVAYRLFIDNFKWNTTVRSLGIRINELVDSNEPEQLSLFVNEEEREKHQKMDVTVDSLREKFGKGIIKRGIMYNKDF